MGHTTTLAATFPPLPDWINSPGFIAACAVAAALLILGAVALVVRRADKRLTRQLDQQHQHITTAAQQAAIDRCWQRLTWVITTADTELAATDPASANMGLGPELAEELLKGIGRDAKELGDQTLARAAAIYLSQLGLVLTHQTQRLTETTAATKALTGAHAAPTTETATAGRRRQ